jgi:hypothetical protein
MGAERLRPSAEALAAILEEFR